MKRRYILAAVVLIFTGVIAGIAIMRASNSPIVECHVGLSDTFGELNMVLDDADEIQRLVTDPIERASSVESAKYIFFGGVTLVQEDGAEVNYALYKPLGTFSRDDKYYRRDLSECFEKFKMLAKEFAARIEKSGS